MFAMSQRWRWNGVLALLVMGLVSGCFSDEEEASPTEEADTSESAEAQENADGENTAEGGGEGSEEVVDPDVDEPEVEDPDVAEPDVEEPETGGLPDLSGTYFFTMQLGFAPDLPLQFVATTAFSTTDTGGKLLVTLQALSLDVQSTEVPREPVGDPIVLPEIAVDAEGYFEANLGNMTIPGAANPIGGNIGGSASFEPGGDISTGFTLKGQAFSEDMLCGGIQGEVSLSLDSVDFPYVANLSYGNSTFRASRLELDEAYPVLADMLFECAGPWQEEEEEEEEEEEGGCESPSECWDETEFVDCGTPACPIISGIVVSQEALECTMLALIANDPVLSQVNVPVIALGIDDAGAQNFEFLSGFSNRMARMRSTFYAERSEQSQTATTECKLKDPQYFQACLDENDWDWYVESGYFNFYDEDNCLSPINWVEDCSPVAKQMCPQ